MSPQSGTSLPSMQEDGITQTVLIHGVAAGQGGSVKLRWRLKYKVAGEIGLEQGEVASLPIA